MYMAGAQSSGEVAGDQGSMSWKTRCGGLTEHGAWRSSQQGGARQTRSSVCRQRPVACRAAGKGAGKRRGKQDEIKSAIVRYVSDAMEDGWG